MHQHLELQVFFFNVRNLSIICGTTVANKAGSGDSERRTRMSFCPKMKVKGCMSGFYKTRRQLDIMVIITNNSHSSNISSKLFGTKLWARRCDTHLICTITVMSHDNPKGWFYCHPHCTFEETSKTKTNPHKKTNLLSHWAGELNWDPLDSKSRFLTSLLYGLHIAAYTSMQEDEKTALKTLKRKLKINKRHR